MKNAIAEASRTLRNLDWFEVQSIPTLVILDHGQVVDKRIGALPAHQPQHQGSHGIARRLVQIARWLVGQN